MPAGTPSVPTFWGQRYGQKPDPAFILAQRLDPEKGFSVIVDKLRPQTRHLATDDQEPRPGQTVNIKAQINNFSLVNLGSSFRVEFYLGDPDEGGSFIGEVIHGTGIPARGSVTLTQPWTIPAGITATSVEIHAIIDPSNQVDEIHEDNNRAWAQLYLRQGP